MLAATQAVAAVDGAGVLIGAVHSLAYADALFAMIRDGAGVTVKAFAFCQGLVGAAARPLAGVDGAVVTVVTGPVICQAVAVVVDAVTLLDRRLGGRTLA
jgi:hypothetical protein